MEAGGFTGDIVSVTLPGRWHEDGPIRARIVHTRDDQIAGDRVGLLRLACAADGPWPLRCVPGPDMDLCIDDDHGVSL